MFRRASDLVAFLLAASAFAQRGSGGYVPAVNSGGRAFGEHRYSAAAYYFRYALEWNSRGVDAHLGLGNVYLKVGKRGRAVDEFAAALQIDHHSSEAERGIHEARSEGQEALAFEDLEKQVAQEPNNADFLTTFAEELVERQRLDEAKTYATKALTIDAHQWHAFCALGRIAAAEGKYDEAAKNLEIAIAHDSTDDDAISTMGDILMRQKRPKEAVAWYRRLVRLLPDEREGHEKLADAYEAAGDAQSAAAETATVKRIAAQSGGDH